MRFLTSHFGASHLHLTLDHSYFISLMIFGRRVAIEKSLDEDFLQPDANVTERTSQLMDLVSQFDETAMEALTRLLKDKKGYESVLRAAY